MSKYTREQTIEMLSEAALYVDENGSYRIINVDEDEGVVYLLDEDDFDEMTLEIDDIDLSLPDVLLYKFTLMNGAT